MFVSLLGVCPLQERITHTRYRLHLLVVTLSPVFATFKTRNLTDSEGVNVHYSVLL